MKSVTEICTYLQGTDIDTTLPNALSVRATQHVYGVTAALEMYVKVMWWRERRSNLDWLQCTAGLTSFFPLKGVSSAQPPDTALDAWFDDGPKKSRLP